MPPDVSIIPAISHPAKIKCKESCKFSLHFHKLILAHAFKLRVLFFKGPI